MREKSHMPWSAPPDPEEPPVVEPLAGGGGGALVRLGVETVEQDCVVRLATVPLLGENDPLDERFVATTGVEVFGGFGVALRCVVPWDGGGAAGASGRGFAITPSASAHESTDQRAASSASPRSVSRVVSRDSRMSCGSLGSPVCRSDGTFSRSAFIRMFSSRLCAPQASRSNASHRRGSSQTFLPCLATRSRRLCRG